jgi:hypothetical protein
MDKFCNCGESLGFLTDSGLMVGNIILTSGFGRCGCGEYFKIVKYESEIHEQLDFYVIFPYAKDTAK